MNPFTFSIENHNLQISYIVKWLNFFIVMYMQWRVIGECPCSFIRIIVSFQEAITVLDHKVSDGIKQLNSLKHHVAQKRKQLAELKIKFDLQVKDASLARATDKGESPEAQVWKNCLNMVDWFYDMLIFWLSYVKVSFFFSSNHMVSCNYFYLMIMILIIIIRTILLKMDKGGTQTNGSKNW